jgi:hypothetical protein
VSSLLAHARKQEISLPVARLLLLVRSAPQLFKLHTRLSLQERFSISLGEDPRLVRGVRRVHPGPHGAVPARLRSRAPSSSASYRGAGNSWVSSA